MRGIESISSNLDSDARWSGPEGRGHLPNRQPEPQDEARPDQRDRRRRRTLQVALRHLDAVTAALEDPVATLLTQADRLTLARSLRRVVRTLRRARARRELTTFLEYLVACRFPVPEQVQSAAGSLSSRAFLAEVETFRKERRAAQADPTNDGNTALRLRRRLRARLTELLSLLPPVIDFEA